MNGNFRRIINDFSYSFVSNVLVLTVSTTVLLIVPKFLGVDEFGYWQLYILYTSLTALLHLGWNDGIFLRYGGLEYEKLDKILLFSQFWMLVSFEIIVTTLIIILSKLLISNVNELFTFRMTVICSLIIIPRGMLLFVLQGTNRIKDYSISIIIEKIIFLILVCLVLTIGIRHFEIIVVADLIGKSISFIFAAVSCKDLVLRKLNEFIFNYAEALENIKVGINVTFAYVASTLIIGIIRLGIEFIWDIETFGRISLTLSISNLLMVFINAIGLILFPILKRTDVKRLPNIYKAMRISLTLPVLCLLSCYYPIKLLICIWLPDYSDSLNYMAILFPICLFEGKMGLLINPYLKSLRKEKILLVINIVSLGLSFMLTGVFTLLFQNINLSVISILIVIAFRCFLSELIISKILNLSLIRDIMLELTLIIIFIALNWNIDSFLALLLYLLCFFFYIILKWKELGKTFVQIKRLIRS